MDQFTQKLNQYLPDVEVVYMSGRNYGGFANKEVRGEPATYESNLVTNGWLKENPVIDDVAYAWEPYLWAPACSDSIDSGTHCYEGEDFMEDGFTHLSRVRERLQKS